MITVRQNLRRFLQEDDATAAVEYAVVLSLIVVAALPAITLLGERVRDVFLSLADALPEHAG